MAALPAGPQPHVSVLIARASTEDPMRVLETLEALRVQEGAGRFEVIVADRVGGSVSAEITRRFPDVRLLPFPAGTTLPALRTAALDAARGRLVAVTEDHCIPPPGWLASIAREFDEAPAGTVAVGGAVENGVFDSALDDATFLCEYSGFLPPLAGDDTARVPGMNVAYEHAALLALDRRLLVDDFWEAGAHAALARRGRLIATDRVRIVHAKRFRAAFFLRQRFLYSRHYAGMRCGTARIAIRSLACAARVVLPPVLLFRIARSVLARPGQRRSLLRALPWLSVFVVVWAAGEMAGCAAGPGDALRRIE